MTTADSELLRRYVADQSEAAFATLVERHVDLVFSAALRLVSGDAQAAQDVTQAVFCDLARQASRLVRHPSLSGWLYTSTRYVAAKTRRTEQRRCAREQQAHAMNQLLQTGNPDPTWQELRPVLDDAMHGLSAADRQAVLLRYFENRPLAEIGGRLGLSENAARMRVERALDKLRAILAKHGVTSTTAVLAASLARQAVAAAPPELAAQVTRAALTAGAVGGGFLAGVQSFLGGAKTPVLAGGVAVAVILVGVWVAFLRPASDTNSVSPATAAPLAAVASASPDGAALAVGPVVAGQAAVTTARDQLLLDILIADTGTPLPNARIEYWLWEGTGAGRKTVQADRFGKCTVPVPRTSTTQLILVSQCDGFADTRLAWRPDRGETIPDHYTLRAARSVPIGGLVVDAEGHPVAGAEVSFGNQTGRVQETRPQSDNFDWPFHVTAETHTDGRWRIDRIAEATLRTVTGRARHPDHVQSESVSGGDAEALRQLREDRYVFRLGRAVTVRGLVVDTADQPVPGAKVLVGMRGDGSSRETTALAAGTFEVSGCKPGASLLSAEAPGFAPTTQQVELTADAEPFRLTLSPGKSLRLRVVDNNGTPVPRASVWLNTFRPTYRGQDEASPVQIEFNRRTDDEGRIEWDTAPDRELYFSITAPGFMRADEVMVHPDGTEHVVVLKPALTIRGAVHDAASGVPIPRFRIIIGWPAPDFATGTTNATWSTMDRFWLSFEGGEFRHVFEEPVVGGVEDPAFVFKFEAEGYASLVSRVVRADEGEVRLDVRLRPASTTTVTVLLPEGRPAANADIGLVSLGSRLSLVPGGLSRENVQSGGSVLAADAQGQFRLPPDDTITHVIAAHPAGVAEVPASTLAADPVIRLQPWGRLEGRWLSRGQPAADRELQFGYGPVDLNTVSSEFMAYRVKTDREGRFAFPQVPPGRHRLVHLVPEKAPSGVTSGMAWSLRPLQAVDIQAGETTTVTIGSAYYTVQVWLEWPAGLQRKPDWRVAGVIRTPVPQAPEEAKGSPQALQAWRRTPEIAAVFANSQFFALAESADGSWVVEDLPAGSYVLHFNVFEPAGAGAESKQRARAEMPVVVPADPPSGLLDLGEIHLEPTP